MPYNCKEERQRYNSILNCVSQKIIEELHGNKDQQARPRLKFQIGPKKKKKKKILRLMIVSFNAILSPSAKGCNIPKKPTALGPILLCTLDINLRSNKVKKATQISKGTIIKKILIKIIADVYIISPVRKKKLKAPSEKAYAFYLLIKIFYYRKQGLHQGYQNFIIFF